MTRSTTVTWRARVFDPDEDVADAPAPPPMLEDDEAKEMIEQARSLYELIDKTVLPPGRFNAYLQNYSQSHQGLRILLDYLRERLPEDSQVGRNIEVLSKAATTPAKAGA